MGSGREGPRVSWPSGEGWRWQEGREVRGLAGGRARLSDCGHGRAPSQDEGLVHHLASLPRAEPC